MIMSVLAHVVKQGPMAGEPAATQALAYILSSSEVVARAFVTLFRQADIEFEPGSFGAEVRQGEAQPDLTVYDSKGQVRAFIENKFWAGLTENQPVTYLNALPDRSPGALLFIVPEKRIPTIWKELQERCTNSNLPWENEQKGDKVLSCHVQANFVLIASWKHVLSKLLAVVDQGKDNHLRHDILQLQDLAVQMDSDAFLPIQAEDVTNQDVARRLVSYISLLDDITENLKSRSFACTKGLSQGNSYYGSGRFLRLHKRSEVWLGVTLRKWANFGKSPLWLRIANTTWNDMHIQKQFFHRFNDAQLIQSDMYIPIRLPSGVERENVVSDAAEQIVQIGEELNTLLPRS